MVLWWCMTAELWCCCAAVMWWCGAAVVWDCGGVGLWSCATVVLDVFKYDELNMNLFSYDWDRDVATKRGGRAGAQQGGRVRRQLRAVPEIVSEMVNTKIYLLWRNVVSYPLCI